MATKTIQSSFSGQKIFVGIDTHKKDFKVSIMVENQFYKTFTTPPDPIHLVNYLQSHFPDAEYHSAYEAGFAGFSTHKKLVHLKVNSIVVNPADIPTTQKQRIQKEDKRDSRKIAAQLQAGQLKAIYIPSDDNLEDRALLRARDTVSKDSAREKQRIKSFLYFSGINFPEQFSSINTHWSNRFITWLESLDFNCSSGKYALRAKINSLKNIRQQKLLLTRQIRELSRSPRYHNNVQLLISVPGIAMLTAMKFLTELEDIARFKNFNHFCSYCGLIPSTNSSSDNERIRGITIRKNFQLRKALIESAWVAIRNDPALMSVYLERCKRTNNNKTAVVRIAKKLLSRIFHVLTKKEKYIKNIISSR